MVQLQSVQSRLEDQPQPRQAEPVAPRRTVGGRRSVLMTITAAIASGVAPVVPFRGRFEAVVMEFQGVGVAGLTIAGTTFLAAAGMVAVAEKYGVLGLAIGGAIFLVAAAMLAVTFARIWQPTQEPEDSGSELLRRELFARSDSLVRAGRQEEAISAYNELIDRFATRNEPEVALLVAQAMLAKGSAYGQRERWDVALVAFGTLIARYGQAESQDLLVQVAKAMLAKGAALVQLDQLELASGVLRDVISKFGGTGDAAAQDCRDLEHGRGQ